MSTNKSQHRKPAPKPAATAPKPVAPAVPLSFDAVPAFFLKNGLVSLLVFALAFLAYANTLRHGFTLDDVAVIGQNKFTKMGFAGLPGIFSHDTFYGLTQSDAEQPIVAGGRYRPLSVAVFAVVYQFFGENAFVFHLLTVLLFALCCLIFYKTSLLLLRQRLGEKHAALLSFLAAVLFAVHPIHTEAVANVKGCDEILALALSLSTLFFSLKYIDTQRFTWAVGAGLAFFAACLSKENAATYLLVVPLGLWFFRSKTVESFREFLPQLTRAATPLLLAFLVFFVLRGLIVNAGMTDGASLSLMNNPFLKISGGKWVEVSFGEKLAMIFYTLGLYVKLLFIPHPLTHDYYPRHVELMNFGNGGALLSLLLYVFLGIAAAAGFRRKTLVSFGILYFLATISLVSNLFFPVGTNMSERFAFMPSVGFCLIVSHLALRFTKKEAAWEGLRVPLGVLALAGVLFFLKTVTRNTDWASNRTLFFKDIEISKRSAKLQASCGGDLYNQSQAETDPQRRLVLLNQALDHLNKAIEIHPNYVDAIIFRGACYESLQHWEDAVKNYAAITRINPEYPIGPKIARSLKELAKRSMAKNDLNSAQTYLDEAWNQSNADAEIAVMLAQVQLGRGSFGEALRWMNTASEKDPTNKDYLLKISELYAQMGDPAKAEEFRAKAGVGQ